MGKNVINQRITMSFGLGSKSENLTRNLVRCGGMEPFFFFFFFFCFCFWSFHFPVGHK
jgi:hypothetical protein